MHSDPIADMATRMRNAHQAGHTSVSFPHSKVKELVLTVLKSKRYISNYSVQKDGKFESITVTFDESRNGFNITRISKPGQRIYKAHDELKQVGQPCRKHTLLRTR